MNDILWISQTSLQETCINYSLNYYNYIYIIINYNYIIISSPIFIYFKISILDFLQSVLQQYYWTPRKMIYLNLRNSFLTSFLQFEVKTPSENLWIYFILRNHAFSLFLMKEIIFLILFIWLKNIFSSQIQYW